MPVENSMSWEKPLVFWSWEAPNPWSHTPLHIAFLASCNHVDDPGLADHDHGSHNRGHSREQQIPVEEMILVLWVPQQEWCQGSSTKSSQTWEPGVDQHLGPGRNPEPLCLVFTIFCLIMFWKHLNTHTKNTHRPSKPAPAPGPPRLLVAKSWVPMTSSIPTALLSGSLNA